jgi:hypothetical protein
MGILTGRIEKVRLIEIARIAEELRMPRERLLERIDLAKIAEAERMAIQAEKFRRNRRTEYGRLERVSGT